MSRNLSRSTCYFCGSKVVLDEDHRPIEERDCGAHYYDKYRGMLVAKATCPLCETSYLAWLDGRTGITPDLSFRSTFDDEPGAKDIHITRAEMKLLCLKRVIRQLRRTKKIYGRKK